MNYHKKFFFFLTLTLTNFDSTTYAISLIHHPIYSVYTLNYHGHIQHHIIGE